MLNMLIPIQETIQKSAIIDFRNWFKAYPNDALWYVASDYCLNDQDKNNDVVSFSIVLNHDKYENIKEYIHGHAPKDIKNTRTMSIGFLQYLRCPVVFNFCFVFDRKSKLFRQHITKKAMAELISELPAYLDKLAEASSFQDGFIQSMKIRIKKINDALNAKNVNEKLNRQIFLISSLASVVFYTLATEKDPSYIKWVSDRDPVVFSHDTLIYDLAYISFIIMYTDYLFKYKEPPPKTIDKPNFIWDIPNHRGKNDFDELIRLPDYLSGTLADMNFDDLTFSNEKFEIVLLEAIQKSSNNAIIQIYESEYGISSRRMVFSA